MKPKKSFGVFAVIKRMAAHMWKQDKKQYGRIAAYTVVAAIYPFLAAGVLVILDEPASALDPIAEAEIYEKFNGLVEDKTVIYISHRMSSSVFCD